MVSTTSLSAQGLAVLIQLPESVQAPVTVSFCDKEAAPPAPQSRVRVEVEPVGEKTKAPALKVRSVIWLGVVTPSLSNMPVKEEPPVSSSPQKNLPVAESQPKALVSESQSDMVTPVALSVREKAEILAVPTTSKLPDKEAAAMENKLGMDRVGLPATPSPFVTVI